MKCGLAFLFVAGAAAAATDSSPIQKVITLLSGMLEKGKAEKHEEEVQFAAYEQFCGHTKDKKNRDISEETEAIEMYTADIGKYDADAAQLGKEVTNLDTNIATWQGDIKAATNVREVEKVDYAKAHQEYGEAIDALQHLVTNIKQQAAAYKEKMAGAASFVELNRLKNNKLVPLDSKRAIDAFLSTVETLDDVQVPTLASGSDSVSHVTDGAIVEMLQKLLDKFSDERTNLEKEEVNAQHAYSLLLQDLNTQIEQAGGDRGEKVQAKAAGLQARADANGDLNSESDAKADDTKYLGDLTAECKTKYADYKSRQELRGQEIDAIEQAIKILQNKFAKAAFVHLASKTVQGKTAFPQLRSRSFSNSAQEKATFYLQEQAKQLNSRVLSAVAMHAQADPFNKVKKMLKDLIVRLMEEANEETEHKGWCDTELGTNEQTRKEKSESVTRLKAEIDELESSISELSEDISDILNSVSELDNAMAEATKLRQGEKDENTATVTDAQQAQTAVATALSVLKEFYEKAAEATAFVQVQKGKQNPDMAVGIIGMMEQVESDFARLEAETSAAEATAQKNYDNFISESKVDKASKSKAGEHKQAKKQNQQQALTSKTQDLEGTQTELDAALAYFEKLKPSCVDAGVSYEVRVARRKEEIASLQEAMRILNGEDLA